MQKFKRHFMILKFIILVSLFIKIYFQYNSHILIMISLLGFNTIVMINGYIRNVQLKNHPKYVHISLFFNIIAASIFLYVVDGIITIIYMYCLLYEIWELEKSILKNFILLHSLLYFSIIALNVKTSDLGIIVFSLGIQLLAYLATTRMLYNQKILEIERDEVQQLNEKLKLANIKLQEYALEVEEVTISKERTRVSQELHDSLGHSLMALAMHLEFAKKICAANPQKVEEVLSQSERIAKDSINNLRKAVTLLNSDYEIEDLTAATEKLINNFYLFSNIKITFNKTKDIDNLNSLIKTSIYKTIQESITNSLKHGNATEINIKIKLTSQNLELVITDNGIGCNNIIKSNGLTGIENRINSLGGTTYYFSHNDLGFGIKVHIPI